jgi:8-oxo-dGTP pyrophosphatase MutT (NUDIX family)
MRGKKHRPERRVDYWADPAAPKPTSRKPSASVMVRNSAGDLLLLRRADSGWWTIPTGGLKKNETLSQCAVRECREEAGLDRAPLAKGHVDASSRLRPMPSSRGPGRLVVQAMAYPRGMVAARVSQHLHGSSQDTPIAATAGTG